MKRNRRTHVHAADPFMVLGIAPTLDGRAIKRAYFEAVKRTPPHVDAAAFQRLRAAYESVSDGTQLMAAYCRAALDAEGALERWNARWQARVDAACEVRRGREAALRGVEYVIERCARLRLA